MLTTLIGVFFGAMLGFFTCALFAGRDISEYEQIARKYEQLVREYRYLWHECAQTIEDFLKTPDD